MGKIVKMSKCHFKGKTNRKWGNGLKIYDSEKFWTLGAGLSPPRGEYTCILQKYSKASFSETVWPIKAKRQVQPGHITKMAAMVITSKNL